MRPAAIAMKAFTPGEEEDIEEAREFVIEELALEEPDDAVGALHRAVSASDMMVRAVSDGNPC
jgi:hypothetical protein